MEFFQWWQQRRYLKKLKKIVKRTDLIEVERKLWERWLFLVELNKKNGDFPYISDEIISKIKEKTKIRLA